MDGYAPFCKHVFVPNFTPAKVSTLAISKENEALLRSAYEARTEQELPVLVRWFPKEAVGEPPVAKFLDVILYSREQIRKEATAMGRPEELEEDAPWGIISVKPQARSSADPLARAILFLCLQRPRLARRTWTTSCRCSQSR